MKTVTIYYMVALSCFVLLSVYLCLFYEIASSNIFSNPKPIIIANYWDSNTHVDASCLNDVYDEIFVITIPQRMHTFLITFYQLNKENINVTVWNRTHSGTNNYSKALHKAHQRHLDILGISKENKEFERYTYCNAKVFYLRQTQIDILKYAKRKQLKKILILEDDITLINPEYINAFCTVEPHIPQWYTLNLGVNEKQYQFWILKKKTKRFLRNIAGYEDNAIKYYHPTPESWGAFGLSVASPMYDIFINLFDYNTNASVDWSLMFPLDEYKRFVDSSLTDKIINVHPSLVMPDVTDSYVRNERENQLQWADARTTDFDVNRFSKYWKLRWQTD
eukprot:66485_1